MFVLYNSIANTFAEQKKYNESITYRQLALNIQESFKDDKQFDYFKIYLEIGKNYYYLSRYDEALNSFNEFIHAAMKDSSCVNHTDIALANCYVGVILDKKKEYNTALDSLKKALDIYIKELGVQHKYTAIVYDDIALVYSHMEKYDLALHYYNNALDVRMNVLGKDEPNTIKTQIQIDKIQKILSEKV